MGDSFEVRVTAGGQLATPRIGNGRFDLHPGDDEAKFFQAVQILERENANLRADNTAMQRRIDELERRLIKS